MPKANTKMRALTGPRKSSKSVKTAPTEQMLKVSDPARICLINDLARAQAVRAKIVEIDPPLWKTEIAALLLKEGSICTDSAVVEYLAERLNEHVAELRRNFQAALAVSEAGAK